jgi:hypothetical protein
VPAEDGVWLHEQDSIAPSWHHPGEQDEQAAFPRPKGRTFDVAGRDDQLLAEQPVLGEQLPARFRQIHGEPGHERQRPRGLAQGGLDALHHCGGGGSEAASEPR